MMTGEMFVGSRRLDVWGIAKRRTGSGRESGVDDRTTWSLRSGTQAAAPWKNAG